MSVSARRIIAPMEPRNSSAPSQRRAARRTISISLLAAAGLTALCATGANAGFSGRSFGFGFFPFAHHGHGAFMHRHFDHDRDFAARNRFDHNRNFAARCRFDRCNFERARFFDFAPTIFFVPQAQGDPPADPPANAATGAPLVIVVRMSGDSRPTPRPASTGPKIIMVNFAHEARRAGKLPIVIYGTTAADR